MSLFPPPKDVKTEIFAAYQMNLESQETTVWESQYAGAGY
ncbi:MAG: hypothetical protein CM15mP62_06160 [Rhodospirillaceae bacterium]|nr:MAG: hypothetical protein CM15mP62_06160 [Rhodospirillaceae bacterium]